MPHTLVVANWKMNPVSTDEAKKIVSSLVKKTKGFGASQLVICPPTIFLTDVKKEIARSTKIALGAQDIFIGKGVSHTGEIGEDMLKAANVKYIIIGHSERRALGETDEIIHTKLLGALSAGFTVIFCVGELERDEHGQQYSFIKEQLTTALTKLPRTLLKKLIIAYEPVWAIGKSEKDVMKPEELHEMTIFIHRVLADMFGAANVAKISVLYGGSVTKNNAQEIIEKGNVQGLLIGRASLEKDFAELIEEVGK